MFPDSNIMNMFVCQRGTYELIGERGEEYEREYKEE